MWLWLDMEHNAEQIVYPDIPSLSAWWCYKGMEALSKLALSIREVTHSLPLLLQTSITFSIKNIILSAGSMASLCACQAQQPSLKFALQPLVFSDNGKAIPQSSLDKKNGVPFSSDCRVYFDICLSLRSISQALFHFLVAFLLLHICGLSCMPLLSLLLT